MITKYQQGGAASDQQAQIQLAIMQISQATGEQPETVVAALKNGKENFKKVLQALQQGDVQGAKQMIQQLAGTPIARFGAKLNYIRSLKGECPEGLEVKYFKEGGRMKCKCVDKAAGGEKVKDGKKEIEDFKKRKACGGIKTPKACVGKKFENGGKPLKPKNTPKPTIHPNDTIHIQNPVTKKMEVRDVTNDHRHKQYKPLTKEEYQKQSNDKKNDIDLKGYCKGGKARKHQLGGSLNRIPFTNWGIR